MPQKQRIILDTNFLLIPAQFGLDIFSELEKTCSFSYELIIFDKSLNELENIVNTGKGHDKDTAKTTLLLVENMISNKKLNIIPAKTGYIDKEIIDSADKDTLVATQDIELRKRLKEKGIKTIVMRQKKHLVLED